VTLDTLASIANPRAYVLLPRYRVMQVQQPVMRRAAQATVGARLQDPAHVSWDMVQAGRSRPHHSALKTHRLAKVIKFLLVPVGTQTSARVATRFAVEDTARAQQTAVVSACASMDTLETTARSGAAHRTRLRRVSRAICAIRCAARHRTELALQTAAALAHWASGLNHH
jgi:hypothetical protein